MYTSPDYKVEMRQAGDKLGFCGELVLQVLGVTHKVSISEAVLEAGIETMAVVTVELLALLLVEVVMALRLEREFRPRGGKRICISLSSSCRAMSGDDRVCCKIKTNFSVYFSHRQQTMLKNKQTSTVTHVCNTTLRPF